MSLLEDMLDRQRPWDDPDDVLRAARFYLHDQIKVLEAAVEVLDHKEPIECVDCVGPGDFVARSYWRVPSSSKQGGLNPEWYTCMETGCTCVRYIELARAVDPSMTPMCKHLIAVRLATALKLVKYTRANAEDFSEALAQAVISTVKMSSRKESPQPGFRM